MSAADFPGLVSAPLGRSSLFAIVKHDFATKLAYADEEVDATSADSNIADLLMVPRGALVLRIRHIIYSTKGKATIYGLGFLGFGTAHSVYPALPVKHRN